VFAAVCTRLHKWPADGCAAGGWPIVLKNRSNFSSFFEGSKIIMIMPANYSVIAENELTYVDGGAFAFYVDPIRDGGQQLATSIVKWIGNAYTSDVLDTFIGVWFKEDTSEGYVGLKGNLKNGIKNLFQGQINESESTLGKIQYGVANAIGVASAIWVLGKYDAVKVAEPAALAIKPATK
jgi:hypothetical protein